MFRFLRLLLWSYCEQRRAFVISFPLFPFYSLIIVRISPIKLLQMLKFTVFRKIITVFCILYYSLPYL